MFLAKNFLPSVIFVLPPLYTIESGIKTTTINHFLSTDCPLMSNFHGKPEIFIMVMKRARALIVLLPHCPIYELGTQKKSVLKGFQ